MVGVSARCDCVAAVASILKKVKERASTLE